MISAPKEPDFFKSTVLGIDDGVQDLGGGCGELCHPFHGGQRHLAGGGCPNYSGGGCANPTILLDAPQEPLEEIESWPPNKFGRGQAVSSFQRSSVSTGWKPKPMIQWKLLGGGKPRKKTEPTKAQEPTGINLDTI